MFSVQALRTRGADGINYSLKADGFKTQDESMFQFDSEDQKRQISSSNSSKRKISLSGFFVLFRFSIDYMRASHIKEGNLLSSIYCSNVNLIYKNPHRPSSIAPNPVESREGPPNSRVSLTSQMHTEKLPEATGTSRGNPGFTAVTQETP